MKWPVRRPDWNCRFPTPIKRYGRFTSNRSEEHTSELQSRLHLVCRLLLEKKKSLHISQHTDPIVEPDRLSCTTTADPARCNCRSPSRTSTSLPPSLLRQPIFDRQFLLLVV